MNEMYQKILEMIEIEPSDRILVVCGGALDRDTLQSVGAVNVVVSNLSPHEGVSDYAPFLWEYQDAENLGYQDAEFDWAVVHAGLHHCLSPHKALCEMLRVARKGIVVVEARDSFLMRFFEKIGLVPSYELEPVLLSDGKFGGLRNGSIPNFVYRWGEREVFKTIESAEPHLNHIYEYFYDWRIPVARMSMSRSKIKRSLAKFGVFLRLFLKTVLPRQGNSFGFVVRKSGDLKPWMLTENGSCVLDLNYASKIYDKDKYRC